MTDSEVDLVESGPSGKRFPISPERLRVFPKDSDIPADQLNTRIDEHFVPIARPDPPKPGQFEPWRSRLQQELRRVVFRCFPERIPPGRPWHRVGQDEVRLETEPEIEIPLRRAGEFEQPAELKRILLVIEGPKSTDAPGSWLKQAVRPGDQVYYCAPRGIGPTRWTRKNPPNYVERCHVLLGRTVDTGRVWDVIAAARYLKKQHSASVPVHVAGEGATAVLAAYAALWEPDIDGAVLYRPPHTHMDPDAPQLLNVLRVCDIPDALGMLAPKPITLFADQSEHWQRTSAAYAALGKPEALTIARQ